MKLSDIKIFDYIKINSKVITLLKFFLFVILGFLLIHTSIIGGSAGTFIAVFIIFGILLIGIPTYLGIIIYLFIKKRNITKNIIIRTATIVFISISLAMIDPMPVGSYFLWFDIGSAYRTGLESK